MLMKSAALFMYVGLEPETGDVVILDGQLYQVVTYYGDDVELRPEEWTDTEQSHGTL